MSGILLAALILQSAGKPADPPNQTAQGKPKVVCTTVRVTGSRVNRQRRCITREEAEQESLQSRNSLNDAARQQNKQN